MATELEKKRKRELVVKEAINGILAHERSKEDKMPEDLLEKIAVAKKIVETEAVADITPAIVNTFAKYKAKYIDELVTLYSFKASQLLESATGIEKKLSVDWTDANSKGETIEYSSFPSAAAAAAKDHVIKGVIDDTFMFSGDPSLLIENPTPSKIDLKQFSKRFSNYRNIHTLPSDSSIGSKYIISFQFKLRRFPSKTREIVTPEFTSKSTEEIVPGNVKLHKYFCRRSDLIEFTYGDPNKLKKIQFGAMSAYAKPRKKLSNGEPATQKYHRAAGPFSIAACIGSEEQTHSVYTDYKFKLNTLYNVTLTIESESDFSKGSNLQLSMKVNQMPEQLAYLKGKVWSSSLNWLRKFKDPSDWNDPRKNPYLLARDRNIVLATQPGFLSAGMRAQWFPDLNRFLDPGEKIPKEMPEDIKGEESVRYHKANTSYSWSIQNDFAEGAFYNLSQIKAVPYDMSAKYSWINKQTPVIGTTYSSGYQHEHDTKERLYSGNQLHRINAGVEISEININAQLVTAKE